MLRLMLSQLVILVTIIGLLSINGLDIQSGFTTSTFNTTSTGGDIQWRTYNTTKLGFSIEYPSSWEVYEKQSRFEQGKDLTISSLEYPSEGQFVVSMLSGPPTTNIIMLTNIAIDNFIVDFFDVDYETRLIENTNLTRYSIDGDKAGSFVYVMQEKDNGLTLGTASEAVVTVHNSTGYIMEFISSAESFDVSMTAKIREHMFNSIKWLR